MSEARKAKVLVTVPNTGHISKHVVLSLLRIQQDPRGTEVTIMLPQHRPLENSQAQIQKEFLEGDWDFWLSIDSDNPPIRNPLDLVFLNKDIIGCPTPVLHILEDKPRDWPVYWNVMKEVREKGEFKGWLPLQGSEMKGLQEADAIGGGCWIVARRVLEKLRWEKPFQRTWNLDGTVDQGNDFSFCQRAKDRGFKIWAHYDYPCRHFVECELHEVNQAYAKAKLNG